MKILVTYGSKLGGTGGLAEIVGDELRRHGFAADVVPAAEVATLEGYEAVIVGGALYAGRWHRDAARFVRRHRRRLRDLPVWLFSSGPLDATAVSRDIPPVRQVRNLMDQIDAAGHQTFGGRLEADAPGFMARAMAKKFAGDWRDPRHVTRWTTGIAAQLIRTSEASPA